VLDRYLQTVGAAPPGAVRDLFDWSTTMLERARQSLDNRIVQHEVDNNPIWAHVSFERWRA
ncbi:MAG: hypothetical protein ACRD1T_06415, partial [Acidimicrobiia bacterium]